jgi:hypothetical protein
LAKLQRTREIKAISFVDHKKPIVGGEKLNDEGIEDAAERPTSCNNACCVGSTTVKIMADDGNGRRERQRGPYSTQ